MPTITFRATDDLAKRLDASPGPSRTDKLIRMIEASLCAGQLPNGERIPVEAPKQKARRRG